MPGTDPRPYLLLLCLAFTIFAAASPLAAQGDADQLEHLVQAGDTWTALSWRYGIAEEALRQANFHLNQQQQPAIGQNVTVPEPATDERMGRLVNSDDGGLLQLSAITGANPWQVAIENGLVQPYQPLLYRPLFISGGSGPPRQLPAGISALEVSQAPARPGEALAIRGQREELAPLEAYFDGRQIQIAGDDLPFTGLIGTGAFFTPGQYPLELQVSGQPLWSQPWQLDPGEWTFEEISYTGAAATISAETIQKERERLALIWSQFGDRPLWTAEFQEPLQDYLDVSSRYGARRSYAGGPYDRYHEGLDFSAYGGTAVSATGAGIVVLAEVLDARGGAVIIDHGLGVFSGYYHLSEVLTEPGQSVAAGDVIGRVGSTGLSTGNHLHWDLLVDGTWVDPAAWLDQGLGCWLLAGWGFACPEQS